MIMSLQTAPSRGITKKTVAHTPATGDLTTALDRYLLDSRESGGAIAIVEHDLAPRLIRQSFLHCPSATTGQRRLV